MLDKLKEYKEIISLVIFFLGGFFWIQDQFPDKKELASVRCLLKGYMKLTQLQIRRPELDKEVHDLSQQLSEALASNDGNGEVESSPAMKTEREQVISDLRSELGFKKDQYRQTVESISKINDALARGICEGGTNEQNLIDDI